MRPKRSISMDSEIEEVPLTKSTSKGPPIHKKISFEKLRRYSIQTCEFCEAKCENRIDLLIHNSTHIIIPLLRETPCNCHKCGFFCISEEHLINHLSVKHDILMEKQVKVKNMPIAVFEEEIEIEEHYPDDGTLDNLVNKEQISNEARLLQGFFLNCKVDIEKFDMAWLDTKLKVGKKHRGPDISSKYRSCNGLSSLETLIKMEPLLEKFKHDYVDKDMDERREYNGTYEFSQSVHYNELMKPGIFQCKHCFKLFPTRYDEIVHEADHIDLSKVLKKKPGRPPKCLQLHQKQLNTPTKHQCRSCKRCYSSNSYLVKHMKICMKLKVRKTVKVCTNCIRSKINSDYTRKGTSSKPRNICSYCKRRFEKLTVFQIGTKRYKNKQRLADRIQFEDPSQIDSNSLLKADKNFKQPKTNNERLKLIKNRFKLINQSVVYVSKFAKDGVRKNKMIG